MSSVPMIKSQKKGRGKLGRAQRRFVLFVAVPGALYTGIGIFSLVWAFVLMFFKYSAGRAGGPILGLGGNNPFVGLEHFVNMIQGVSLEARQFRTSLGNTLIFALAILPVNLAITLPLASLIESVKNQGLKNIFRAIYFLPVVTSSVGVALMWESLYDPKAGLINEAIRFLGGPTIRWLSDPRAQFLGMSVAMWAVIMAYLWQDYGYNMVIFIAALQNVPKELKEAAIIDGANAWHTFTKITVPLLRPTLLFVCVMTMISSFQIFDIIQVMTNGEPREQTRVLMLDIYDNAFRYGRMGWSAAIGWVLTLIVMIVTIIQMRVLRTDWEY